MSRENMVKKAIDKAGGVIALARLMGERYQTVQKWATKGRMPLEKALVLERVLGGAVRRHELFPDEYDGYELVRGVEPRVYDAYHSRKPIVPEPAEAEA